MNWHRDILKPKSHELEAPIKQALANVIEQLPPGSPVVLINNLSLTINYASGGGATVNVRNK